MKISPMKSLAAAAKRVWPRHGNRFSAVLALGLLLTAGLPALAQDDDYLAIYTQIQQADDLVAHGKTVQAHSLYVQSKQQLSTFKQTYPAWNVNTVNFRLKDLDAKIASTANAPAAVASAAPAATRAMAAPASALQVTSPGSEPRRILKWHPLVGDKQSVTVTTKSTMSVSMAGNTMPPMAIPSTVQTMDIVVTGIDTNSGEVSFSMTFGPTDVQADPSSPAAMVDAMKTSMAGLNGMTGTAMMSAQGVIHDINLTLPPGADPQLSGQLDQIKDSVIQSATVLPDVAVGSGAKWIYTDKMKAQGMTINQTADCTLESLDGDNLLVTGIIRLSAANQTVTMQGTSVNLTQLTGSGKGSTTANLGHIAPANTTANADIDMQMQMGAQGQSMEMKMGSTMTRVVNQ